MKPAIILFLIACLLGQNPKQAEAHRLVATSGAERISLIELYSSESCSSCPPADRWIGTLKDQAGLWRTFVPVVFHVDYWNDLGWIDILSSHSMTKRQHDEAQTWKQPAVYTPAVVIDGKEWKGWPSRGLPELEPSSIHLSVYQEKNGSFKIEIKDLPDAGSYNIVIARLGMNIGTSVKGGENSGKLLIHNFVVLDWDSQAIKGKFANTTFNLKNGYNKELQTAIAVWVEKSGVPGSLQAAGGYL